MALNSARSTTLSLVVALSENLMVDVKFDLAKELEEFEINEYLGSEDWPKYRCKRLIHALIQERKQTVCRKATVTQSPVEETS